MLPLPCCSTDRSDVEIPLLFLRQDACHLNLPGFFIIQLVHYSAIALGGGIALFLFSFSFFFFGDKALRTPFHDPRKMPFPRPDEVAASSGVKSGSPETGRKREVAAAAASWLGSAIGGFSQQVKGFAADVISESTGEIDGQWLPPPFIFLCWCHHQFMF